MIGRTRVLLNMNPQLVAGSHERVWQGMAMGCVVLSNPSLFLRQFFSDGEDILYTGGDLAPRIGGLIGDAPRLQDMADRARGLYLQGHTWKNRVPTIIEAIAGTAE